MEGECSFLVCNLGIISLFGEEALANVSMTQTEFNNSQITGIIRLRAGSQVFFEYFIVVFKGMVLNIGEKLKQCIVSNIS